MILAYSDIKFCGELAAFDIALRPTCKQIDFCFKALQKMIENKDILRYDIKEICAHQYVKVRIQIRLNQIVWNNGLEIEFNTTTNFLAI